VFGDAPIPYGFSPTTRVLSTTIFLLCGNHTPPPTPDTGKVFVFLSLAEGLKYEHEKICGYHALRRTCRRGLLGDMPKRGQPIDWFILTFKTN